MIFDLTVRPTKALRCNETTIRLADRGLWSEGTPQGPQHFAVINMWLVLNRTLVLRVVSDFPEVTSLLSHSDWRTVCEDPSVPAHSPINNSHSRSSIFFALRHKLC